MEIKLTEPNEKYEARQRGAALAGSIGVAVINAKREERAVLAVVLTVQESADLDAYAASIGIQTQAFAGAGVAFETIKAVEVAEQPATEITEKPA